MKDILNSLGIITIILGSLFSVLLCLSILQIIYKCLLYVKTHWCSFHTKESMDNLDNVIRMVPRPIAHSSKVKVISKRTLISQSATMHAMKTEKYRNFKCKHSANVYAGNYGLSNPEDSHGPHSANHGGDGGDLEFLDKISSSSSAEDSDSLECYSSQSLNTYTLWE